MKERSPINKKDFAADADRLCADALVAARLLAPKGEDPIINAIFMVLIQNIAVRAIVYMARGHKPSALKAADLLHRQIVNTLNKSKLKGDNDAESENP